MLENIQTYHAGSLALPITHGCFWPISRIAKMFEYWTPMTVFARFSLQEKLKLLGTTRLSGDDDAYQIARIANGDKQAIGVLYERHHKRVFYFVRRFISNVEIAEDLTNDIFIEVWQKAASYEGRSKVSSWILGIARFKALTEVRKQRPVHDKSEEILNVIEDDADDPEMVSQKLDKGAAIKRCIEKLSNDHRVILDLVYYHEKSIEEVSEILDIPKNTVKTRTFHARKLLSAEMTAQGLDRGWP